MGVYPEFFLFHLCVGIELRESGLYFVIPLGDIYVIDLIIFLEIFYYPSFTHGGILLSRAQVSNNRDIRCALSGLPIYSQLWFQVRLCEPMLIF